MSLTNLRTLVRRDLKDEDSNNYRWTNDEIDRAIQKAVWEFSLYIPRQLTIDVATTQGSYNIDLSSLASVDLIDIVKAEHPIGQNPPAYRRFRAWGNTLTLRDGEPADGSDARIYYEAKHSITSDSSTIPIALEHIVALGAAAIAVLSRAQYITETAGIGGVQADSDLREWGNTMYDRFITSLKQRSTRNRIKTSTLYPEE